MRHRSSASSLAAPKMSPVTPPNFFMKKNRYAKLKIQTPKKTKIPFMPINNKAIPKVATEDKAISRGPRFSVKGLANPSPDLA